MLNKESVNKARSLYYGFLSKLFVFTTSPSRYEGLAEALEVMAQNPLDENSGEALREIQLFFSSQRRECVYSRIRRCFSQPFL